ncbi:sialin [Caerostris darwini]|uniref:Sialin n=1 Tax=Caerostris darwini TaxID=1538125 RepID=A0AAV4PGH4_9ARAC|nr:sialin [Caerostris darwini]
MALNGFTLSGFNVTHVDLSPEFAGTLYGISNTIANINGITGPIIVGYFLESGTTIENWNSVFYIASGVYVAAAMFFNVFASAERQNWSTKAS